MGPESKDDYTLYLDGVPIARGEIRLPEITVREEGVAELAGALVCEPVEFTAHFKTPKRWRCGSRKRFIKLLMSKGICRNQAGSVAKVARIAGVPYRELWRDYFFWGGGKLAYP